MATPITITLTRGGAYLLEAALQRPDAFTTPATTAKAAKLWSKLRKANPAVSSVDGSVDFEKGLIKEDGESDIQFARRSAVFNDQFKVWENETCTLEITEKLKAIAKTAAEWAIKNRDKIWPRNSDHVLSVLEAVGLDDDE